MINDLSSTLPWVKVLLLLLKSTKNKMEVSECLLSLKQKQQVDTMLNNLKFSINVIVDYRGLTVAVAELRSQLREAGVEYKVYKTLWFVVQLNKQVSKA